MNTPFKVVNATFVGLTAGILLAGCSSQPKPSSNANTNTNGTIVVNSALFSVVATGAAPLSYQWYIGTNVSVVTNK
jgi:uncharacterized lipoprotein YajG